MKLFLKILVMSALLVLVSCSSTKDQVKKTDTSVTKAVTDVKADAKSDMKDAKEGVEAKSDAVMPLEGKALESFNKADLDKDGKLSKEEFAVKVDNKFTATDLDKDGKLSKEECPSFDKLNKDGDDSVSKEELVAGCTAKFAAMDTDNDGFITKMENAAALAKLNTAKKDAETKKDGLKEKAIKVGEKVTDKAVDAGKDEVKDMIK